MAFATLRRGSVLNSKVKFSGSYSDHLKQLSTSKVYSSQSDQTLVNQSQADESGRVGVQEIIFE